jgi:hypothetical protein
VYHCEVFVSGRHRRDDGNLLTELLVFVVQGFGVDDGGLGRVD